MFGLFVQGATAGMRPPPGLGVGLSLAQRLVQAHGGTIAAASEGVGTRQPLHGDVALVRAGHVKGLPQEALAGGAGTLYFLRAAIAFSALVTRSAPIVAFHLSYTGRVALTKASRSAGVRLRDRHAHAGDVLEQRLVGLDQALAGERDLLLAGVDGGLAHDLLVGRRPASPRLPC